MYDLDHRISVFRTEGGAEVDFILEFSGRIFAIEVKAKPRIDSSDLRGLRSFSDFFSKEHDSFVVTLGEESDKIDGIHVGPLKRTIELIFEKK